jgi:hypothetical protein
MKRKTEVCTDREEARYGKEPTVLAKGSVAALILGKDPALGPKPY